MTAPVGPKPTLAPRSSVTTGATDATAPAQATPSSSEASAAEPAASPERQPPSADVVQGTRARASAGDGLVAQQLRGKLGAMDEAFERDLVGKNKPGVLVPLSDGEPDAPLRVSVHGINASPDSVGALSRGAVESGAKASTFAYDDNFRRLGDVSNDLAGQLEQQLKDNPDRPLIIDAHSMGTRVSLVAIDELNKRGALEGRQVELNLIAPPLDGVKGAGWSYASPPGLGALVPNIRPGKDMASGGAFQRRIDDVELPENVRVRVFTGGQDDIVREDSEKFQQLADRFAGAEQHHFESADHDSVIGDAAAALFGPPVDGDR